MCARYVFSDETEREIRRLVRSMDPRIDWSRKGEVRPNDHAVILTGRENGPAAGWMPWGFPFRRQLLINARSETALEKPMFAQGVRQNRCLIPAAAFFEWNRRKEKVTFRSQDRPVLYMAGFYRNFDGQDRFIILTRQASEIMLPVHDRMPLILPEDRMRDWLYDPGKTTGLLSTEGPLLDRFQEYEQYALF